MIIVAVDVDGVVIVAGALQQQEFSYMTVTASFLLYWL